MREHLNIAPVCQCGAKNLVSSDPLPRISPDSPREFMFLIERVGSAPRIESHPIEKHVANSPLPGSPLPRVVARGAGMGVAPSEPAAYPF